MDILWFLKRRITFIRQLFAVSSAPYIDRKARIEAHEEPYVPVFSQDGGEPQFLGEWIEAEESLQALAHACISMATGSLQLYFKAWEREVGKPHSAVVKSAFGKGWPQGYQAHFLEHLGIDIAQEPSFGVLHELVLARNRVQHPEVLQTMRATYGAKDLKKLGRPFFLDERELGLFSDDESPEAAWLMEPSVHVTAEKLEAALTTLQSFADWFEARALAVLYP